MNKNLCINLILSVILSVLLSGCGGTSLLPQKYNDKIFNEGHKAVAIIDITVSSVGFFSNNVEVKPLFRLVKLNDNYNDPNKREVYTFPGRPWLYSNDYNDKIAMLNPGLYYIDYIAWTEVSWGPEVVYYTKIPGISKKGAIVYGAFEVKPGDVAYVGNFLLKKNGSDFDLEKIDTLEQVKKDLIKNEKNALSAKIKEIKFYNRGSIVHRNADGSFIIKNN